MSEEKDPFELVSSAMPFEPGERSPEDNKIKDDMLAQILATPTGVADADPSTGDAEGTQSLGASEVEHPQRPAAVASARPRSAMAPSQTSRVRHRRPIRRLAAASLAMIGVIIAVSISPFGGGSSQAEASEAIQQWSAAESGVVTHESNFGGIPQTTVFTFDGDNAALDAGSKEAFVVDDLGYLLDQNGVYLTSPIYDRAYVLQDWTDDIGNPDALQAILSLADDVDATATNGVASYRFTLNFSGSLEDNERLEVLPTGLQLSPASAIRLDVVLQAVDGVLTELDYDVVDFSEGAPRGDGQSAFSGTITYSKLGEPQDIESPSNTANHPDRYRLLDGEMKSYLANIDSALSRNATCAPAGFDATEFLVEITDERAGEFEQMQDCLGDADERAAGQSIGLLLERRESSN